MSLLSGKSLNYNDKRIFFCPGGGRKDICIREEIELCFIGARAWAGGNFFIFTMKKCPLTGRSIIFYITTERPILHSRTRATFLSFMSALIFICSCRLICFLALALCIHPDSLPLFWRKFDNYQFRINLWSLIILDKNVYVFFREVERKIV